MQTPVDSVSAGSPVDAGTGGALVDVRQALGVKVAARTGAHEAVDPVRAHAPVVARVGRTLVDVFLAVHTCSRPTVVIVSEPFSSTQQF